LIDCYTDLHHNFGIKVTSLIEGNHGEIKSYLKTSTGDLKMVVDNIELMIMNKEQKFEALESKSIGRSHVAFKDPLFDNVRDRITSEALKEVLK
jgi:hypothetical protein